jgi:hypothetical protein
MIISRKAVGTCAYICGSPFIHEDFSWSWSEFRQFNADWFRSGPAYVHYDRELSSDASVGRNEIVRRLLGDWLFFTDVDHLVSPDLLIRMLDRMIKHEAKVVVGLYQARGAPHHPILYRWTGKEFSQLSAIPGGVGAIDAAGCGCMLIKREVLLRIRDELHEEPFTRCEGLGEDFSFFRRLMRLEIPVLCDPRLIHPHLRIKAVMPEDCQVA